MITRSWGKYTINWRENVIIRTATDTLDGELIVGADGLPTLEISHYRSTPAMGKVDRYRPWTLPAAWSLHTVNAYQGPLYDAWTDIEAVMQHVRDAQHEAREEQTTEHAS